MKMGFMGTAFPVLCAIVVELQAVSVDPNAGKKMAPFRPRISQPGEHPYMVSIEYSRDGKEFIHICDGTIVGEKLVLTAAHCFDWRPETEKHYYARAGFVAFREATKNHVQLEKVADIHTHPFYLNRMYDPVSTVYSIDYDVAVLHTQNRFRFTFYIRAIRLSFMQPNSTDLCYVVGWGKNLQWEKSDILQSASAKVSPSSDCSRFYGFSKDRMLCVKDPSHGSSCKGDIGSPLVCETLQCGLLSIGVEDCKHGTPVVYTSVGFYTDFIKTHALPPETFKYFWELAIGSTLMIIVSIYCVLQFILRRSRVNQALYITPD